MQGSTHLLPVHRAFLLAVLVLTVCYAAGGLPGRAALASDPCAGPQVNPIPCENSNTGTDPSIWGVSGAGDPSIQGFASDISVNVGATIGFKVKTGSINYSLTIYRLGY